MTISEFAQCEADYDPRFAGYYDGAHPDPDEERPCLVAPPLGDVVAEQAKQIAELRQELQSLRADCSELQRMEAVRYGQIARMENELTAVRKDSAWDMMRIDNAERMIHKALNHHVVNDYGEEVA